MKVSVAYTLPEFFIFRRVTSTLIITLRIAVINLALFFIILLPCVISSFSLENLFGEKKFLSRDKLSDFLSKNRFFFFSPHDFCKQTKNLAKAKIVNALCAESAFLSARTSAYFCHNLNNLHLIDCLLSLSHFTIKLAEIEDFRRLLLFPSLSKETKSIIITDFCFVFHQ